MRNNLRDGVLLTAGNLDDAMGGPSADLTPAYLRRTVYGKVSRYKLDEYLQLFDFPSPSISAEKRFVTTVPLQRLFLMNSDFMQMEAEELAKRVANEPDNRSSYSKEHISTSTAVTRPKKKSRLGLELSQERTDARIRRSRKRSRLPQARVAAAVEAVRAAQLQAKAPG